MRIAIWPVERAGPYAGPLTAAGHEVVPVGTPAEVLMIDFDSDHPPHSEAIAYYRSIGARVFMYPHGAGVLTAYDGIHPVTPGLDGAFVIGEGQSEVMRRHGYPVPTYAIGWPFGTAHLPFRACDDVRRVLFAPWHPIYHRWIVPEFAAANRRAYTALLALDGIELTVRHIDSLELNGLWPEDGVRYVQGQMDGSTADLADADVVVTPDGTYAYLAMSHGVPLVMYGQDVQPCDIVMDPDGSVRVRGRAAHWHEYRDCIRYPFGLEDGPALEVLQAAAASEEPTRAFRDRFMGQPMDGAAFVELLERLCGVQPGPAYDGRRASAVLALAPEIADRPDLLARYAATTAPDDDRTLVLLSPALDDAAIARVEAAIERAGLTDDTLPDVLLAPVPTDPVEQRALAREASAFLGDAPPPAWLASLPPFGDAAPLADAA